MIGFIKLFGCKDFDKMQPQPQIFTVKEVITRSNNIKSLILENDNKMEFVPGQYCFVLVDEKLQRPLSYCSASGESHIELTFKKTGYFTGKLFNLKKKDKVTVKGPYGGPLILNEAYKNIILIAGGVGIAPFMSILRTINEKKLKTKVSLFYSAKKREDLLFKEELDSFKNIKLTYTLTQENPPNWKGETRRVDLDMIKKHADIKDAVFYICGPHEMTSSISAQLINEGIERKNIRTEKWQ